MKLQRKALPFIIGGSIIILAAYAATSATRSTVITSTPQTPLITTGVYALSDIAKHSDSSSCWTVVNGNVYDLTQWITQHPGGESAILGMCGIDATNAFMNQHGGQNRPEQYLATFKIGSLVK